MKKLLGIIILSLLLSGNAYAEEIKELNDSCVRKGTLLFDKKVKLYAQSKENKKKAYLMYFGCISSQKQYWQTAVENDFDTANEKANSGCLKGASEYGIKNCHLFSIGNKIVYGKDAALITKIEDKLKKKLGKKKKSGGVFVHEYLLWDNLIFTKKSPTTFEKLTFNKEKNLNITKRVKRTDGFKKKKTFRSFNFTAVFENNITVELFVEYEKNKKDFKKAEKEALFFSHMYGQMPNFLKTYNKKIFIHNDNEYDDGLGLWWVNFNKAAFHINVPRYKLKPSGNQQCNTSNSYYSHCAITMAHELAHVIQELGGVISTSKWSKARKLDKKNYVSEYAMTDSKEDFAESIAAWIAVRYKTDMISKDDLEKFNEYASNRFKFFDELNFNMYPL